MTVRRLSISVSPEVEEVIKHAAARAGLTVSAWLARAAEHAAAIEAGRAAVAEFEAEHGAFTEEERRRVRQELIEDGIIAPDELKEAS
jgi:uncharacterized protein (DUF1778 family)